MGWTFPGGSFPDTVAINHGILYIHYKKVFKGI